MSLSDKIMTDMKTAMKNHDKTTLDTVRMIKSALMNEKIKLGHDLNADEELTVLNREKKQREESIEEFAKAKRDDLVEETKKEEPVQKPEEDIKDEVPPAEEVVEEKPQEEEKPDISEFMEGIEGNAAKASDVNTDNVLAKLNALPFKERTKFYKENMDLINEAMRKARGQAQ